MGYLYYGNYALYYEVGRVEAIRDLGLVYKDFEEKEGVAMPVVSLLSRYLRPVFYDELITVRTEVRKFPSTSITFHTEMFNESGDLLNAAEVKLVFIEIASGKRIDVPALLCEKLSPYFE